MFYIKQLMSSVSKNVCLALFFASMLCPQAWAIPPTKCTDQGFGTCAGGGICVAKKRQTKRDHTEYECQSGTCSGTVNGTCGEGYVCTLNTVKDTYSCECQTKMGCDTPFQKKCCINNKQ